MAYQIQYYNWNVLGINPNYRDLVVSSEDEALKLVLSETERLISLVESETEYKKYSEGITYEFGLMPEWGTNNGLWKEVDFEKDLRSDTKITAHVWAMEVESSEYEF